MSSADWREQEENNAAAAAGLNENRRRRIVRARRPPPPSTTTATDINELEETTPSLFEAGVEAEIPNYVEAIAAAAAVVYAGENGIDDEVSGSSSDTDESNDESDVGSQPPHHKTEQLKRLQEEIDATKKLYPHYLLVIFIQRKEQSRLSI